MGRLQYKLILEPISTGTSIPLHFLKPSFCRTALEAKNSLTKDHLDYSAINYRKKNKSSVMRIPFTVQHSSLWKMAYLPCGSKILFTPPNLTFIFKQRLDRVWGVVLCTFFIWTHCVAIPSTVSPTRFTSAAEQKRHRDTSIVQISAPDVGLLTSRVPVLI